MFPKQSPLNLKTSKTSFSQFAKQYSYNDSDTCKKLKNIEKFLSELDHCKAAKSCRKEPDEPDSETGKTDFLDPNPIDRLLKERKGVELQTQKFKIDRDRLLEQLSIVRTDYSKIFNENKNLSEKLTKLEISENNIYRQLKQAETDKHLLKQELSGLKQKMETDKISNRKLFDKLDNAKKVIEGQKQNLKLGIEDASFLLEKIDKLKEEKKNRTKKESTKDQQKGKVESCDEYSTSTSFESSSGEEDDKTIISISSDGSRPKNSNLKTKTKPSNKASSTIHVDKKFANLQKRQITISVLEKPEFAKFKYSLSEKNTEILDLLTEALCPERLIEKSTMTKMNYLNRKAYENKFERIIPIKSFNEIVNMKKSFKTPNTDTNTRDKSVQVKFEDDNNESKSGINNHREEPYVKNNTALTKSRSTQTFFNDNSNKVWTKDKGVECQIKKDLMLKTKASQTEVVTKSKSTQKGKNSKSFQAFSSLENGWNEFNTETRPESISISDMIDKNNNDYKDPGWIPPPFWAVEPPKRAVEHLPEKVPLPGSPTLKRKLDNTTRIHTSEMMMSNRRMSCGRMQPFQQTFQANNMVMAYRPMSNMNYQGNFNHQFYSQYSNFLNQGCNNFGYRPVGQNMLGRKNSM